MIAPTPAASSVYTGLHLCTFQGVLILVKYEYVIQAELRGMWNNGTTELGPCYLIIWHIALFIYVDRVVNLAFNSYSHVAYELDYSSLHDTVFHS